VSARRHDLNQWCVCVRWKAVWLRLYDHLAVCAASLLDPLHVQFGAVWCGLVGSSKSHSPPPNTHTRTPRANLTPKHKNHQPNTPHADAARSKEDTLALSRLYAVRVMGEAGGDYSSARAWIAGGGAGLMPDQQRVSGVGWGLGGGGGGGGRGRWRWRWLALGEGFCSGERRMHRKPGSFELTAPTAFPHPSLHSTHHPSLARSY